MINVGNLRSSELLYLIQLLIERNQNTSKQKKIGELCFKIADWEALGRFCDYHGLGPLAYTTLSCIPTTPPKALKIFRNLADRSFARYIVLIHRLKNIQETFRERDIAAILLKGPVLAESLYPAPALRPFEDLDLLIRRENIDRAVSILGKLGFYSAESEREERFLKSGFHRKFRAADKSGVVVELHWELLPPDFKALPVSALWEDSLALPLSGIDIRALSPADEFIYSSVHLAKHIATSTLTRGIWIADLERMIPEEISDELCLRIKELHCARMVFFAVALVNNFRGLPTIDTERWGKSLGIAPLIRKILQKSARPQLVFGSLSSPSSSPPSKIGSFAYRTLMADEPKTAFSLPFSYLKRRFQLQSETRKR